MEFFKCYCKFFLKWSHWKYPSSFTLHNAFTCKSEKWSDNEVYCRVNQAFPDSCAWWIYMLWTRVREDLSRERIGMNYTAAGGVYMWFTVGVCWSNILYSEERSTLQDRVRVTLCIGLHLLNYDKSPYFAARYFFLRRSNLRTYVWTVCYLLVSLRGARQSLLCKEIHHWPPFLCCFPDCAQLT